MKIFWLMAAAGIVLSGCAQMNDMMGKNSSDDSSSASTHTESAPAKTTTTTHASTSTKASADESAGGIYGNPPAGSPFSKLKIGMSSNQVINLIGQPTDQKAYVTGKAWIPFYFGKDRSRMEFRYKGEGVITFAGSGGFSSLYTVSRVIYNPKEAGYEH